MADNKETIIVGVEFDAEKLAARIQDTAKRMSELRKEAAELKKAIKEQGDEDGALAIKLASVQTEMDRVQKEQKGLIATTKQLTDADTTYGDSLNEMRRRLGDLQKAYDNLSAAERESAAGQELQKKLQEQDAAVKQLEQSTGRFQRNVGNYPSAFNNVLPGLNKATEAMQKMGLTMEELSQGGGVAFSKLGKSVKAFGKTMLTPPVVLIVGILSAIMLAAQKVSEAFKKNDDAMTNLQTGLAALKPIGQAISKMFDSIANGIGKLVEGAGKLLARIGGEESAFAKAAQEARALVKAEDDLEETERKYTVAAAENAKEVSRLRSEAAETTDLSKRKEMLQQAINIEKSDLEQRKAIAAERLRIAQAQAKQNVDTSDETKNKIAKLQAESIAAEQAYYDGTRKLNKEIAAVDKERLREKEEAAKVRLEIERHLEDALIALDKNEITRAVNQARVAGEREVEDLKLKMEKLKKTDIKAREAMQQLILAKEKETQQQIDKILIEAEQDRMQKTQQLAIGYATLGQTNATKLAEIEVQAAQAKYDELLSMDEAHIQALYGNQQDYEMAVLESEQSLWQAKRDLKQQQYEEEQLARETELQDKILQAGEDSEAVALAEEEFARARYDNLVNMDAETKAILYNSEEKYKQAVIQAQSEMVQASKRATAEMRKNAAATASAITGAMGSLSNVLDNFSQQNAAAARASKAIALGKIAVETGIAIATGTAQAMDLPFPANLAAIVTTVATVLANIATAISTVKDANFGGSFAEGGFIPGTSYTGDRVTVRANSAEALLTPQQQRNFMELANGGGVGFDYATFADVLTAAVAAQPAPVMDYAEFTDFQRNVSTYNEFARI